MDHGMSIGQNNLKPTWDGDAFPWGSEQDLAVLSPGLGLPKNGSLQRRGHLSSLLELPQEEADLLPDEHPRHYGISNVISRPYV